MAFSPEQIASLNAKLAAASVKTRSQSGRSLSYIEGWHVISEANRIFGFDAWASETVEIKCVSERERKIGQQQRDGWSVSYVAKVRVTVEGVVREGVGAGHGIDVDLGLAHESAIKEAETDARKRALMTFGNPFGLALYDKTQENVGEGEPAKPSISQRAAAAVQQPKHEPEVTAPDTLPRIEATLIRAIDQQRTLFDLKSWAKNPDNRDAKASLPADAQARVSQHYEAARKDREHVEMAAMP